MPDCMQCVTVLTGLLLCAGNIRHAAARGVHACGRCARSRSRNMLIGRSTARCADECTQSFHLYARMLLAPVVRTELP